MKFDRLTRMWNYFVSGYGYCTRVLSILNFIMILWLWISGVIPRFIPYFLFIVILIAVTVGAVSEFLGYYIHYHGVYPIDSIITFQQSPTSLKTTLFMLDSLKRLLEKEGITVTPEFERYYQFVRRWEKKSKWIV